MEANLGFNGFNGYHVVFSKAIMQSESQDSVVSDTLPDIAEILCVSGCVLIRSKDIAQGHVRLEANIPARVCCVGEGERRPFCMDVNIPFYLSAEDDEIPDGSVCTAELTLLHLEARMLNPRKITVRAEIRADLLCYGEGNETFSTAPEDQAGDLHVLEQETELTAISCVTERTFVLTDEYELGEDRNAAAEIAAQNADVQIQDVRSVGSKLIVKGTVRSELLILSEDDELEEIRFQTSFSQIIETQTDAEDACSEIRMLVSGMYYELTPGSDGRCISMELHLAAQATLFVRRKIRYLADAYSNVYALTLRRQQRELALYDREVMFRETCSAALDAVGEISEVIACRAEPIDWTDDGDAVSVRLLVWIAWKSGEIVRSAERTAAVRVRKETAGEAAEISAVAVQDVLAAAGSSGMELRLTAEVRGHIVHRTQLNCITGIEYDASAPLDTDDRPTLVILYQAGNRDLWTLAKENCSTVEAICAANDISDGILPADRLLLIPKTI